MKLIPLLCVAFGCALAVPLNAAKPPEYSDARASNLPVTYNYYKSTNGKWEDVKNWSRKQMPTAEEDAILRDNVAATIATKVPNVRVVALGGQKMSTLTLSEGASLTALEKIHINRNDKDAVALLIINGGYLRAGGNTEFPNGLMNLGTSATHSSKGTVEMNAGTFEGGIVIGTSFQTSGQGKLSIRGKKPVIRGVVEKRDGLCVNATGTIEFILDAEGAATLDFTKTWAGFKKGGTLRVEGTAYKGGSQTITLIDTKKLSDQGAVVECEGFDPAKYKADVEFSSKGLFLKIKSLSQ